VPAGRDRVRLPIPQNAEGEVRVFESKRHSAVTTIEYAKCDGWKAIE
jgi:hypothetical protein